MKDKELKVEEIEVSHTRINGGRWCPGEREAESAHVTLMSDTLKPNGHTGTGTRSGIWLRNRPTDLSVCVSEECGHG